MPRGERTETVCRILVESMKKIELEKMIYDSVKRAMKESEVFIKKREIRQGGAGEIREDILGFLSSL